ncbi:hypothetical protein FS837_008558, partial [Tulasnella sp. UAMH 9824]
DKTSAPFSNKMSSQANNKSQIAAAFAVLGLTKSQVLAIFDDHETPTSSTAPAQSTTTSEHRQPQGDPDSASATMFLSPAMPLPQQEAATPAVQQFGSQAATHPTSAMVSQVAPFTRLGLVEPSTGSQAPPAGVGVGFGHATEYFGMHAAPPSGGGIGVLRSLATQPVLPASNTSPALGMPQYLSLPPES